MTQIRIWWSTALSRQLPVTRDIKMSGEMEYEEVTMVSGKRVMDVRGYRDGFSAHWDWFPATALNSVLSRIRAGGYFRVDYPSDDGTDATGYFKIEQSSGTTIFKFVDGVPMWHDVTLQFTAQELKAYE